MTKEYALYVIDNYINLLTLLKKHIERDKVVVKLLTDVNIEGYNLSEIIDYLSDNNKLD